MCYCDFYSREKTTIFSWKEVFFPLTGPLMVIPFPIGASMAFDHDELIKDYTEILFFRQNNDAYAYVRTTESQPLASVVQSANCEDMTVQLR